MPEEEPDQRYTISVPSESARLHRERFERDNLAARASATFALKRFTSKSYCVIVS